MKIITASSKGFTAVELLITLFVAAMFLAAGYQLFSVVMKDGGETRAESSASNVAYDYLRRNANAATNPCTPQTPVTNSPLSDIPGVENASITVTITCPQSDAPTVSQIESIITYGIANETKTVRYATYTDRSKGATPNNDVTRGLIAWWKLNGNASDSAGSANGTIYQAVADTGQNGQPNGSMRFNGSTSFISVPANLFEKPATQFTVTAWFKANSLKTNQSVYSITESGGWSLRVPHSSCSGGIGFYVMTNGSYQIPCSTSSALSTNTWIFTAVSYDSQAKLYVNNLAPATVSTSGTLNYPADPNVPFCIGAELTPASECQGSPPEAFDGSVDDVRIYNRALSQSEIQQIYTGGAK